MRPVLQIEPAADDRAGLPRSWSAPGVAAARRRRTEPPQRGRRPGDAARAHARRRSGRVDASISTCPPAGPGGAVALDGTFALNGQPFASTRGSGAATDDTRARCSWSWPPRRGAARAEHADLRRRGRWRADAPRLRGELVFAGAMRAPRIGTLGAAPSAATRAACRPGSPPVPAGRTGRARRRPPRACPTWLLELDDTELERPLAAWPSAAPAGDRSRAPSAAARAARRAGRPRSARRARARSPRLARRVRGRIDLADRRARYRGARRSAGCARRCSCRGDGSVTVEHARAILPGQTDVSFTGALAGPGADIRSCAASSRP